MMKMTESLYLINSNNDCLIFVENLKLKNNKISFDEEIIIGGEFILEDLRENLKNIEQCSNIILINNVDGDLKNTNLKKWSKT